MHWLEVSTRTLRWYTQEKSCLTYAVRSDGGSSGPATWTHASAREGAAGRLSAMPACRPGGSRPIEHLLTGFGVAVTCTGQAVEDEAWEQELVQDVLAIVTSFAGRLYGQRSARARRLRAVVVAKTGWNVSGSS